MESKDGNVEENSSGLCLGMQFKTADDAYRWYNDYARRVGFSVRIDRQERSRRDGEVISRVFVCSREGKRRVKDANKEKKTNTEQVNARVGCQAYLMVKRRRGPVEDCWEVTRFHELHNHDLVPPTKVPFLRSHKRRPPSTENYIENIPNSRIHEDNNSSSPVEGAASSGNCVALEETATGSGVADPVLNAEPSTDEADTLVEYMGQKPNSAESEPPLEVDPCPTLGGDSSPRLGMRFNTADDAYTWYNDYARRVGFSVRINHQEKSRRDGEVISRSFVCSREGQRREKLNREKRRKVEPTRIGCQAYLKVKRRRNPAEDFWVVTKFHKPHNHDLMCPNKAILLRSHRRIRRSMQSSIENFQNPFVSGDNTASLLVGASGLSNSVFSQRDSYNNLTTDHRYKEECEADFQTLYSNPVLKIYLPMEAQAPETFTSVGNSVLKMQLPLEIQAAEAYTKVVFKDFQEELVRSLCYAAEEVEGGWELKTYRVREYWQDTQQHSVTFNVSETRATCTCLMFESEGILCRHALKIFLMCGVLELPSYYLLERWTRNAKSRDVYDQQGVVLQADWKKSATMRYNDLCRRAIKCAEDGATSVEVYDMAVSAIERCWKEIVEAKKIEARNAQLSALLTGSIQEDNIEGGSQVDHSSIQINLEDPQGIITKGGPSDQTFDGSLEKRKGAKTCSVCKGHDHNKRKCPHLEGQREFMAAQDQLPTGQ
ncbi:hypothetical protein MRB53_012936 [Persea americana]|uniref:Uncharacterized protein n=1 Tax=Persea americana TaxID=3435 RepID=A0ACC2M039_PERAE|nr:hypothetical protein MRB53_012936 [Persea americana]